MKKYLLFWILVVMLLAPSLSFAIETGNFTFDNPLGRSGPQDLVGFLNKLLDFITLLAVPIIVLMLIFTGFKFVAAQGNADKIAEARKMLLWTLVGAGIILGAHAILFAIQGTVTQIRGVTG